MQETQVGSLGWEDPLQKEMASSSSPWGCKELDTTERLNNNKGGSGTQEISNPKVHWRMGASSQDTYNT